MARDVAEGEVRGGALTPRMLRRELRDFLRAQELRRRQLPRALLVGLFAGLVAVAFRGALAEADDIRDGLIAFVHAHPLWAFPLPLILGAVGAAVAVYLVRRFAPEASVSSRSPPPRAAAAAYAGT